MAGTAPALLGVSWERLRPVLCGAAASLGVLSVVAWTVAPSVTFGDSGELLAAAVSLGVAHAPGYPLWCILAHLAIRVSPLATPGVTVNLLSALYLGVAGLLVFLALRELACADLPALACSWAFCLSPLVWDQATTAEVYTLDAALLAGGLWLTLRLARTAALGQGWRARDALALGLMLGAGIAHRPFHLFVHAFYALLLLAIPRRRWFRVGTGLCLAAGIVLALSVLTYLPLRSGAWPGLPWGLGRPAAYRWAHVTSWEAFRYQTLAGPYTLYMWGALPRLWGHILLFDLRQLKSALLPWVWVLAALGAAVARRRLGARAWPILGLILPTWLMFWNYVAVDQEVFFLPLYLGVCSAAAVGLTTAVELTRRLTGERRATLAAIWLLVPLVWTVLSLPATYRLVDRSRDDLATRYAASVLGAVDTADADIAFGVANAVADHRLFPLYYVREAYGWGKRIRTWLDPQDDNTVWRPFLEWMEADDAEIEEWMALSPDERTRVMVALSGRRGRLYGGGSAWIEQGGGYPDTFGYVTRVHSRPVPGLPDAGKAAPWLAWARLALALRPADRAVQDMAFAPLLEVAWELARYGATADALAVTEAAQEIAPLNARVSAAQAEYLVRAGRGDEAIALLRRARDAADTFDRWYNLSAALGKAYYDLGRWAAAVEPLEDTIAIRGSERMFHERMRLAVCYRHLGRTDDMVRVTLPISDRVKELSQRATERSR